MQYKYPVLIQTSQGNNALYAGALELGVAGALLEEVVGVAALVFLEVLAAAGLGARFLYDSYDPNKLAFETITSPKSAAMTSWFVLILFLNY